MHLIVEAGDGRGLSRGLQGLAIRIAKAVNRTLGGCGRVWSDRYHARALRTPREVRNALVYVLQNWRKHVPGARGLDRRSSGGWFDGWQTPVPQSAGSRPVVPARTWLATVGCRRLGLLHPDEEPAHAARGSRPPITSLAAATTSGA